MGFFSFQKQDRLLKRHEFQELTRCGKKITNKHFIAFLTPAQTNRSRLGITVSKKVGKATARNRIKRFSREYFRLNRDTIKGKWDICLIAKTAVGDATSEQVFMSLEDIFNRISRVNRY